MRPLRFVPYSELGDTPNVIVDGAPTASTALTLSHWPGSPTPDDLLDDVSAQIAFRALDRPSLFDAIEAVSNNHFDQDGLASAFTLLQPEEALRRRPFVIDVAKAGDFATFESRDAIRVAMALAAFADPARSPLDASVFEGNYDHKCACLHEALLPRFADLLDHPESVRPLWEREDAHLDHSLAAIDDGTVKVEEEPAIDLAVVTVPEEWADQTTSRFAVSRTDAVHPAAVNRSTSCFRILVVQGNRYRVELRYESWVMYRSRLVLPRPDLRVLAAELAELEPGAGWTAEAPGSLTPMLMSAAPSALSADAFRTRLEDFLTKAPPAWDPYAGR